MKKIYFLLAGLLFFSCNTEKPIADLLVKNAVIYTVNEDFETVEAFTIRDGKILDVGTTADMEKIYNSSEVYDAEGKTIFPGFIDAHAHLLNLGISMQQVDLVGTKNYDEVLQKVVKFQNKNNTEYIIGRGWDQNDWDVKEFPTKKELDSLFPNTPVSLRRIDGHAMIVNRKALELAGITSETKMPGGEVILIDGEPSGLLVDTPMRLVWKTFPKENDAFYIKAIKDAEKKCLKMGLTTINEAGSNRWVIEKMDSLQQKGEMSLRIYAMLTNYKKDLDYYFDKGIVKTSFKSTKIYRFK